MSPAPTNKHCRAANRLSFHLNLLCNGEFEIGEGPGVNLNSERTSHRIPDLAVFDCDIPEEKYFDIPPLLAVEIVSPESVFRDNHIKRQEIKRQEYAAFGIPSYWIINPLADKIGLLELRLFDGQYQVVTQVHGEEVFETELPFPVKLVPHWLLASGPWMRNLSGPAED